MQQEKGQLIAEVQAQRRAIELGEASRRMGHQILGALLPICSLLESFDESAPFNEASAMRKAPPARDACDYLRSLGRGLQLLNPMSNGRAHEPSFELTPLLTTLRPLLELTLAPRVRLEWRPETADVAVTAPRAVLAQSLFDACLILRDGGAARHVVELHQNIESDFVNLTFTSTPSDAVALTADDEQLLEFMDGRLHESGGGATYDDAGRITLRIPAQAL